MARWFDDLPAAARELLTKACPDASSLDSWSRAKRKELHGLSIRQALFSPLYAEEMWAWLKSESADDRERRLP